jgi:hypothetical protein
MTASSIVPATSLQIDTVVATSVEIDAETPGDHA